MSVSQPHFVGWNYDDNNNNNHNDSENENDRSAAKH